MNSIEIVLILALCLIVWKKLSSKKQRTKKEDFIAAFNIAKFAEAANQQKLIVEAKKTWMFNFIDTNWWAKNVYKNKLHIESGNLYAKPYDKEILVGKIDPNKQGFVTFENNSISVESRLVELYKYPNLGKVSNIGHGGDRILGKTFLIRHRVTNRILCPVNISRDQAGNWVQGALLAFVKQPIDIGMCLFTYNSDMRFVHIKSGMRMTAAGSPNRSKQAYLWYCDLTPGATRNCQWFMQGSANKIQMLANQSYLWASMWNPDKDEEPMTNEPSNVADWADTEMVFDITTEQEYYGDTVNTCNWFTEFMNQNPDAAKIRDKIKINTQTRTVFVPPQRPGQSYFSLKNRESGRCLHPQGGDNDPGEDTRVVLWSECPSGDPNRVPDKLKMFYDQNGVLRLKTGSCMNVHYNSDRNGRTVAWSKRWCDQPIEHQWNGTLKHKYSGRCLHPNGGRPNQGTPLVSWDGCPNERRLQYDKVWIGQESDLVIGYVDDAHIGSIRVPDGTWVPIKDIFALIAGPKEQFIIENFDLFLSPADAKEFREKFLTDPEGRESFGWNPFSSSGWSWASSAANWIKDRAKDVGNFAKNCANSVRDWAKNLANSIANWATGLGKSMVERLVEIGNTIGNYARDMANKIADTAMSTVNRLKELALEAARLAKELALKAWEELKKIQYALKIFEYLRDLGEKVVNVIWDKIKEAINGIKTAFVNFIRENVIEPLKRKAGEFLWWAERDLKRAVRMIMEALTPLVSAISGTVLNFTVRPIHKSLVNALSAETMVPFESCIWGGIDYKGDPKKGDLGCPIQHINKLLILIGKRLPGTKGVKHELTPQVNKLFVLIAEQFPSPLVNAVREQMVRSGLKAVDPDQKYIEAYANLKKAAHPTTGKQLNPKQSTELVEMSLKIILPGNSTARTEVYKLGQAAVIPMNQRVTKLGGAAVTPNMKRVDQGIKQFKTMTKDPVKALQQASVSKVPMNPKTATYLAQIAKAKIAAPKNQEEAKQVKKAQLALQTLKEAAVSATPLKKSSAIADAKLINNTMPKLNPNARVPVVKVTPRTLGLVITSSIKKVEVVQKQQAQKQETKQSQTPSCVHYNDKSTGVSQKCFSELWKLSCTMPAPAVDSKKQFKYLASDILLLSKLRDLASIKKCYGTGSKQYTTAQQQIDAAVARDRAAAATRAVKLKAAVARDKADLKVVQSKNVKYAIQREITQKKTQIVQAQKQVQKQEQNLRVQKEKAIKLQATARTPEQAKKAAQQAQIVKNAEAKLQIAKQNAQRVTVENKKELQMYSKDLKKVNTMVVKAQKQEAIVVANTNLTKITIVSNTTQAFITAAGSQKGMTQHEANMLKAKATAAINPKNTEAIQSINTLAEMATKTSEFKPQEAQQLATVAISTGQAPEKPQSFIDMILAFLGIK